MSPKSLKEALELTSSIKKGLVLNKNNVVLCPPSIYMSGVAEIISVGSKIKIGAQDCFYEESGAFTGEISSSMLKSIGVKYVIVGHSERRALGETNEEINKKVKILLKNGLKVVFCVGENARDKTGSYLRYIEEEIKSGLSGINKIYFKDLILAYEPLWAIGKDAIRCCEPEEIREMALFIKKVLAGISSRDIGLKIPIIYGGSVDVKNAAEIISKSDIDGLLIGRTSLDVSKFLEMIKKIDSRR